MFERIDTICLQVKDVEKSSAWYQNVLGLEEAFIGENYRILRIGNSSVSLTIEAGKNKHVASNAYPIFFAKDIHGAYRELQEKGVTVGELQHDSVNNLFDFYDLDHNKLQVCFWEEQ